MPFVDARKGSIQDIESEPTGIMGLISRITGAAMSGDYLSARGDIRRDTGEYLSMMGNAAVDDLSYMATHPETFVGPGPVGMARAPLRAVREPSRWLEARPGEELPRVQSAVVNVSGHMFAGATHTEAIERAALRLGITPSEVRERIRAYNTVAPALQPADGFLLTNGATVSREDAYQLATLTGQIAPNPRANSRTRLSDSDLQLQGPRNPSMEPITIPPENVPLLDRIPGERHATVNSVRSLLERMGIEIQDTHHTNRTIYFELPPNAEGRPTVIRVPLDRHVGQFRGGEGPGDMFDTASGQIPPSAARTTAIGAFNAGGGRFFDLANLEAALNWRYGRGEVPEGLRPMQRPATSNVPAMLPPGLLGGQMSDEDLVNPQVLERYFQSFGLPPMTMQ